MEIGGYRFTVRELVTDALLGCVLVAALFCLYVLAVAAFGR